MSDIDAEIAANPNREIEDWLELIEMEGSYRYNCLHDGSWTRDVDRTCLENIVAIAKAGIAAIDRPAEGEQS